MLAPTPLAGVDVGKRFLDLGFEPAAKPLRVGNDAAGIAALVEALRRRGASRVAIEAIGPYAWPLTATLRAEGFDVGIADPRQVRAFRTAEGRIAKTDRLDAGFIARFARAMPNRLRPAPEPEALALKALSTRRRQLTELIAMEKTRLAQAFDAGVAGIVLTDMPELGTLDRKAAASLAGMAPHPDQSGPLAGRNAISGGRLCLRSAFYMAGMVAARCDPRFKAP